MQKNSRFLLCSDDNDVARQLGASLTELGVLAQEVPAIDELAARIAAIEPRAVFLDFTPNASREEKLDRSAGLARALARVAPDLPRIAVGRYSEPQGAVAALRSGVSDFLDLNAADEIGPRVRSLLRVSGQKMHGDSGYRSVLVAGVRPGVGATTLCVHMASVMQEELAGEQGLGHASAAAAVEKKRKSGEQVDWLPLNNRAAILDMGVPLRDSLLYLNISSEFDFVEAARNLQRLDDTLLRSAMAHSDTGICVLPLPRQLDHLRSVSHADSLALVARLYELFGALITDVGGLYNPALVAALARAADETWLVTDQGIGALVSLADTVQELKRLDVPMQRVRLVLNRYDDRYGMTAVQIAQRFDLELLGTIPERTLQLRTSLNQGHLVTHDYPRDPYVRAIRALAQSLRVVPHDLSTSPKWIHWLASLGKH